MKVISKVIQENPTNFELKNKIAKLELEVEKLKSEKKTDEVENKNKKSKKEVSS